MKIELFCPKCQSTHVGVAKYKYQEEPKRVSMDEYENMSQGPQWVTLMQHYETVLMRCAKCGYEKTASVPA